jgi:hypothetical protein
VQRAAADAHHLCKAGVVVERVVGGGHRRWSCRSSCPSAQSPRCSRRRPAAGWCPAAGPFEPRSRGGRRRRPERSTASMA